MDKYEQALLDFADRWAPFGGPVDGDIFVEFGISRRQYHQRISELLASRSNTVDRGRNGGS